MNDATQMIHDIGQRPTAARTAVLSVLIAADTALSHAEVIDRLSSDHQFDRVTIYRVLDWLLEHQLIHRIASEDRIWKFQTSHRQSAHHHAHLQCTHCGKTICLDEIQADLPADFISRFKVESVDINIKGKCSACQKLN